MTQTKNKDFLDEIIDKIDFKGLTQDELGIKVRPSVFNEVSLSKVNRVISLKALGVLRKIKKEGKCFLLSGNERAVEPRKVQYYFNSISEKGKFSCSFTFWF